MQMNTYTLYYLNDDNRAIKSDLSQFSKGTIKAILLEKIKKENYPILLNRTLPDNRKIQDLKMLEILISKKANLFDIGGMIEICEANAITSYNQFLKGVL